MEPSIRYCIIRGLGVSFYIVCQEPLPPSEGAPDVIVAVKKDDVSRAGEIDARRKTPFVPALSDK